MTLEEIRNSGNYANYSVTLDSGININYPSTLDGGGTELIEDYRKIFKILNKKYKNAYEWCAGFGIIGFEILGNGISENIHFSDIYQPAIENCLETAINNNLSQKVFGYVSDNVKDLPINKLFDLVVANPPNSFSLDDWKESKIKHHNLTSWEQYPKWDDDVRIGCDDGFKIHIEFFDNIANKMIQGGDILLLIVNGHKEEDYIVSLAEKNGFEFITNYKTTASFGGEIFHFKLK
jgi:methylase of polypeptide subunit release factors